MIAKLHYISDGNSLAAHVENIQKACNAGVELVQLHIKNISEKQLLKVAHEAREITSHFQTRLMLTDTKVAKEVKADGVHFGSADNSPTVARKHIYTWQLIGATANTLHDCEALLKQEVDYIYLGPFRVSETKNTASAALGLHGYTAIVEALQTQTPILGICDIHTDDVAAILATGISGVAVSNAITNDYNSVRIFNELLKASSTEEQRYTF